MRQQEVAQTEIIPQRYIKPMAIVIRKDPIVLRKALHCILSNIDDTIEYQSYIQIQLQKLEIQKQEQQLVSIRNIGGWIKKRQTGLRCTDGKGSCILQQFKLNSALHQKQSGEQIKKKQNGWSNTLKYQLYEINRANISEDHLNATNKLNQSNFIQYPDLYQQTLRVLPMILELRKTCLDAIQRALLNLHQIRMHWLTSLPKPAQQKLNSVQNDVQLLKDNFTLIASKVVRLESKCNQKESNAVKAQHKYRSRFEQACQAYKILQVKHQKLGKQLSFIKFSNNCLRSQIQSLQVKHHENTKLNQVISDIEMLVKNNNQNLQVEIEKLILSIPRIQADENLSMNEKQFKVQVSAFNNETLRSTNFHFGSTAQFNLQAPLRQDLFFKEEKLVVNSCQLKNQKQLMKTKKKSQNKQMIESKQTLSTDKKKRDQLARLVEQQGRLSKINQRYLSTDIS